MVKTYEKIVLCGDIGGTTTRLAIVGFVKEKPDILLLKHESTKRITDFAHFIQDSLHEAKGHQFTPTQACFGVAGPIEGQKAKLTHVNLTIDARKIEQSTKIKSFLINDFAAVGYGINVLERKDMKTLQIGKSAAKKPRVVLGAGSGLGKCTMYFGHNCYVPMPSEGGHADVPILDPLEVPLMDFIKHKRKIKYVCYDDILSGRGLEDMYDYLQYSKYSRSPKKLSAQAISRTWKKNECAKETFVWFSRFLARCAKNYALEGLATGGVYLAGGIIAKNLDIFNSLFIKEFIKNEEYPKLLRSIPIKLVKNEHVGLLGAAYAALVYKR